MGLQREIYTGELLKAFRQAPSFLKGIPNYSGKVADNNTLHMVDVGADPNVLINNTTYPIPTAGRTDADIAITLDKFDTENTVVTDDELYALSYDKIQSVNESHKNSLVEVTGDKAIHALAPAADTSKTPVVTTTAASFGMADIRKMKRKFDDAKVPAMGRRLVLCPQHVEELLATNENFEKQYSIDNKEGKIGRILGFDIFEHVNTPVYDASGAKIPYGTASASSDRASSVAFLTKRMFQAQGKMEMYKSEAKENPEMRETKIGYRMYHVALPKKQEAIGAIISQ